MSFFKPTQKNLNKLAQDLQKGSQRAGEEIFNHFSPKIFGFFMLRLSHRETAEDLTQGVFLKVVSKIATFDKNTGDFSSWIWQIARNSLTDYFRLQKPLSLSNEDLEAKAGPSNQDDFFETIAQKEELEKVLETIKQLKEEEQEIFSLRYVSCLSFKDISKILKKPEPGLRVVAHRLNKKIKKQLKSNYVLQA